MAEEYNFQYTPLTGSLPGKSFVEQTEKAINELAGIVNEGSAQVEVITNLANTANDNSEEALEKANEALETSGRVYITLPNLDDADDYYDSQLYYFANSHSANLPVEDTGFLEVKTNDTKTAAEQVFIADTTGLMYMRHGDITSEEVGDETVYSVTWETWSSALASETYVQTEVNIGVNSANSYTDEQIRQHGNLPVGYEYFTFNPSIPQGSLPLFGGEYDRDTYSDLWEWVQTQTGYLKTEAEWQTLSASNNGNVPFYSDGDGSTTFRVPSLKCWVRGANGTVTEVGSYLEAGLPNITGDFGVNIVRTAGISTSRAGFSAGEGAFTRGNPQLTKYYTPAGDTTSEANTSMFFDASLSNSIYGNSTTVQPESIVGMWLVKAYGVIVDTGTIDEQQYIDDRMADIKNVYLPANYLPLTGGNITGPLTVGSKEVERVNASNTSSTSAGYIRYESGLQICWGYKTTSSTASVTFPQAFSSNPRILVTGGTKTAGSGWNNVSTTGCDLESTASQTVAYLAIGSWK